MDEKDANLFQTVEGSSVDPEVQLSSTVYDFSSGTQFLMFVSRAFVKLNVLDCSERCKTVRKLHLILAPSIAG